MIVKMSKISLIGLSTSKNEILKELMDLSVVDVSTQEKKLEDQEWRKLVTLDHDEWEGAKIEGEIAKVQTVLDVLGKYYIGKKSLFSTKRVVENAKFREALNKKSELAPKIEKIYELSEHLSRLKNEENRINGVIVSLNPWTKYDMPLEFDGTFYTNLMIGVMPAISDLGKLMEELDQQNVSCSVSEINSDLEQHYLAVIYDKQEEESVMTLLKQYGFNRTLLKDMTGTVAQNLSECTAKLAEIAAQRSNLEEEIRSFMDYRPEIEMIYDDLLIKRDQSRVVSRLLKTDQVFYLEGYVPAATGNKVKDILEKFDCAVTISQPEPDEECPVLMELQTEIYI